MQALQKEEHIAETGRYKKRLAQARISLQAARKAYENADANHGICLHATHHSIHSFVFLPSRIFNLSSMCWSGLVRKTRKKGFGTLHHGTAMQSSCRLAGEFPPNIAPVDVCCSLDKHQIPTSGDEEKYVSAVVASLGVIVA